ncbi:MAG TPA: PDDEXK nuclease domain-containing protein, partial [Bryobacteraceae bacterium]|nr:PDDEXK nuclease domain-containing protein [Bryobacteraceae bacterium]
YATYARSALLHRAACRKSGAAKTYVVIDLKMKSFEPEFAGKMNFYLSAVNDLLRHPAASRRPALD